MTIAVAIKVNDGVALAADSASTMMMTAPDGQVGVVNVYNNANKIVNLIKGAPVGAMAWGAGSVGPVSVTTVFKDLRCMFSGGDVVSPPGGADWSMDPEHIDVQLIASRVDEYIGDHLYPAQWPNEEARPSMGVLVTGYSHGAQHPDMFELNFGPERQTPKPILAGAESGFHVGGDPEAIIRLLLGASTGLEQVLMEVLNVPQHEAIPAAGVIREHLRAPLVEDAMPFIDALDLARYLVDLTAQWSRFMPGPGSVGGPIEVAGITKYEGFKWVSRKHYYDATMNPPVSK